MSPSFSVLFTVIVVLGAAYAETNEPGRYKYSLHNDAPETSKTSPENLQQKISPKYANANLDLVYLNDAPYVFASQLMSWMEAMSFCGSYNMHLVSIETSAENVLIEEHLTSIGQTGTFYWTSANKIGRSVYMWASETNMLYSDFYPGHPGNLNCVTLRALYWWGMDCAAAARPICEEL